MKDWERIIWPDNARRWKKTDRPSYPCHRVIGADGSLTGYSGGLWRKQRLLEIERQLCPL
ncbi:MGMT family protein [Asaia spathodeae]|uniref:MGMT family protein n=1 Tax=Asaia spathodeae TaxID=657016 RepID=UPI002FC2D8BC